MKLKEISVKKIIAGVKEHWNTPPEVSPKQSRRTGLPFGNSFASSSLADCIKKAGYQSVSCFLVGVTRLELATPRPPVWCATTCATPRT